MVIAKAPKISHDHRPQLGIVFICVALFLYVTQDSLIKSIPDAYHHLEIIFFRSLFSVVPFCLFYALESKFHPVAEVPLPRKRHYGLQVLRAMLMFFSLVLYINACRDMNLSALYTLSYTTPLFLAALSPIVLKEPTTRMRILLTGVGFCGTLLILQPASTAFKVSASFMVILSSFLTAIAVMMGRRLSQHNGAGSVVMAYIVVCTLGTAACLPWVWCTPTAPVLLRFIGIGFLGGVAQYAFSYAFRLSPVSRLAPFEYTGLLWGAMYDLLFWSFGVPDYYALLGAACIIFAGVTLVRSPKAQPR